MRLIRFLSTLLVAIVLTSGSGGTAQALTVPLCPEVIQVIFIDKLGPDATPEPPLPAPLKDYSEVLGIGFVGSGTTPFVATPVTGAIDFPIAISEIVANALAENPAFSTPVGKDSNVRLAAVVLSGAMPETDACVVEVWDRQFRPEITAVEEGTTVYWYNRANQNHRARPSGFGICNFDTGILSPGESDSHEFDEPASFPCNYEDPGFVGLRNQITVCSADSEEFFCK